MPIDPATIQAAASVIGQGFNAFQTAANNKKQENFTREMYEKQREDNLKQWHLQNQYNSPAEQMARLQGAGLNPNLVYGKGADNTSAPIATASPGSYSPTAPQLDLNQGIAAYQNFKMQDAQLSNLESQNTVLQQEAALKAATTANTVTSTARTKFDLDLASELRQTSADAARESLRTSKINNEVNLAANERAAIQNDQNLKESVARIQKMREEQANTKEERARIVADTQRLLKSNELTDLDLRLRRLGVSPSDPIYLRALGQALGTPGNVFETLDKKTRDISKNFKEWWKK